ncbi:MAG: CHAP domain-containing protein [Blautia sp.]|nr:CHAP domain-containing protein [Blautia sp.]
MKKSDLPRAEKYIIKHKRHNIWKKIVSSLACVVVFITTYMLILPAITMEQNTFCGYEEHRHDESCYEQRLVCQEEETVPHVHDASCYQQEYELICGLEETPGHIHDGGCVQTEQVLVCTEEHGHTDACYAPEQVLICAEDHEHTEACYEVNWVLVCMEEHGHTDACYQTVESYVCGLAEGEGSHTHGPECYASYDVLVCGQEENENAHAHTEACYERVLTCEREEHTHSLPCYSDPNADIESEAVWRNSVSGVSLTGIWADDVIAIAQSQLGYTESTRNYIVTEENQIKGITRYGQWYGDPYGDWCAMFASFCLNYANVPLPLEASCSNWQYSLSDIYYGSGSYLPVKGDIVFFDNDGDGGADHVGLVAEAGEDSGLVTIEGNSSDCVQYVSYGMYDSRIMGYAALPVNPDTMEAEEDTEEIVDDTMIMEENDWLGGSETSGGTTGETDGEDGTGETEDTTGTTQNEVLPVTTISGTGTEYDAKNDWFKTNLRIEFQFKNKSIQAGVVYTYTYPAGIIVPDGELNKTEKLYDGQTYAGTRTFVRNEDGTYSVQVIFDSDYVGKAGDTVTGYIAFEGAIGKENVEESTGNIVVGSDSNSLTIPAEEITYPKEETESYDIDVSKEGYWSSDGDKLIYTVYVRTTKGTPDPISFRDTITTPEGLTLGDPVVSVERYTKHSYGQYNSWDSEAESMDVSASYADGTISMGLNGLSATPTEGHNSSDSAHTDLQFYKITYTYPITDQTLSNVSVTNNVQVSATDSSKNQTVSDSDSATINVNKDFSYTLDKSGSYEADKGRIKWTVTVNRNKVSIAGATLTDEMLSLVEKAEDLTIEPSNGYTVNYGSVGDDLNPGSITGITFNAADGEVNKNQYTITYYTSVEEKWNEGTVTNSATFDPDPGSEGDEKTATATVTVDGVKLDKSGSYNSSTGKIDWVITVNAGHRNIAGATLTDSMFSVLSETDFTIEPDDHYSFMWNEENSQITGILFTEVTEGEGKNTQSYTIRYSTVLESGSISEGVTVSNTATLSSGNGEETPIGKENTVTVEPLKIAKSGSYENWNGRIKWTITVNESQCNIAGAELTDDMFGIIRADDIKVYDANWQVVSPESGIYTVQTDTQGNVEKIIFRGLGDTGENTGKYVVEYYTDAQKQWSDYTVTNTARLSLDGVEVTDDDTPTVWGDGSISKAVGEAVISEDRTKAEIPWTVTLNIPAGGLAAGTKLNDNMTIWNSQQWMTRDQIVRWGGTLIWNDSNNTTVEAGSMNITFQDSDGNSCNYHDIYNNVNDSYDNCTFTSFAIEFPNGLSVPEGATSLSFTYCTTADLTKSVPGRETQYANEVEMNGKSANNKYVYYKPGVFKYDGNDREGTTTVSSDGVLTWKVKVVMDQQNNQQVTIEDTLPEGVVLDGLVMTGSTSMDLTIGEDGTITGSSDTYQVSGNYNRGNRTVTLTMCPRDDSAIIQNNSNYTITFTCHAEETLKDGAVHSLTNTVTAETNNGEIGSASQTQEWTYDSSTPEVKVVDKSGEWDNTNRRMDYSIVLNPEGKDLVEGVETLTLTDTMTYENQVTLYWPVSGTFSIDATLIPGSVKLYKAVQNSSGEWIKGDEVTGWSWTYSSEISGWNNAYVTSVITVKNVPDGVPLLFRYAYQISSSAEYHEQSEQISFSLGMNNTAVLEGTGYSDSSSGSSSSWEHSSSSGGVSTEKSFRLYKVDSDNYKKVLPNAVFSVYQYDTQNKAYSAEAVMTYTTDHNGTFQIKYTDQKEGAPVYQCNTLYKVKESTPPDGYQLPDTEQEYYFYFSDESNTEIVLPTELPTGAMELASSSYTVFADNVKTTTDISVNKVWKDSSGNVTDHNNGSVTLSLYKKTEKESGSGEISGSGTEVPVTAYSKKYGNSSEIQLSKQNVIVGSRIRIVLTLTYQIPSDWTWTPSVTISGVDGTSEGWIRDNPSTYTYEGIVTGEVSILCSDEDSSSFQIIQITELSLPSASTPDSSDTDATGDELVETVTISASDNWYHEFNHLPKTGTAEDGSTVTYYYYVVESPVANYATSYDNNNGIANGTITVVNQATDSPEYTLPNTGGPGTRLYTLGGLLMALSAGGFLLYNHFRRRKEDRISS